MKIPESAYILAWEVFAGYHAEDCYRCQPEGCCCDCHRPQFGFCPPSDPIREHEEWDD